MNNKNKQSLISGENKQSLFLANARNKQSKIKEFVGTVISDKMEKTVVVEVVRVKPHPLYRKIVKKRKKFYAHDELKAKTGDKVRIRECRPLSKMKRFMTIEITNVKRPASRGRSRKK